MIITTTHTLNRLCLVNLSPMICYPLLFTLFIGSVVTRENKKFLATRRWHDSSAIANISHIASIFYENNNNGAWTRLVITSIWSIVSPLKKLRFSCQTTIGKRLCWVGRKTILVYYDCMKTLFQKICACTSAMSIINSKIATFWPLCPLLKLLLLWFCHVQNDRDSILVVCSLNPLMSIGSIWNNETMSLRSILGWLKIPQMIIHSLP